MNHLALVGKPNSGKSSLFNVLTGLNQKIGNYSGVTVERKSGKFLDYEVIDLPGLKSLITASPEEVISKLAILGYTETQSPILYVANGMQLEDSLLLFSEIADLQIPAILVLNFKDDLEKNQISIDVPKLSELLGCPVVLMNSRSGDGLDELKACIQDNKFQIPNAACRSLYERIEDNEVVNQYASVISASSSATSKLHSEDFFKRQKVVASVVRSSVNDLSKRAEFMEQSKKWDRILLHPVYGILIFLVTIWIVFQSVFYLSTIPSDWIDSFFAMMTEWTKANVANAFFKDIISDGILPGLGGVMIFIPQIAILFLLLGLLEHSGYLSRISFISNRFLSHFGLSGQSVIPLMSSWACAIPAIMSTRVIADPKERLAVILASPLMTCSARLPVYTILIAVMVPNGNNGFFNIQGVILMVLYLLGVVATLGVSKIIHRSSSVKSTGLWSLELPVYRIPNWRNVFYNVYLKTKAFVVDAGKVIFVVSIILWFMASYSPKSDEFINQQYQEITKVNPNTKISEDAVKLEYSYAGYLGKCIEPAIKPLGYDWKIGIALISSFAAREVFVGSLSTIYSVGSEDESLIQARLKNEKNLSTGQPRFNLATCVSLLLFYVFALQCMSTMAIVRKETGSWYYPAIQFVFMLALAYVTAWLGFMAFS